MEMLERTENDAIPMPGLERQKGREEEHLKHAMFKEVAAW